MALQIMDDVLPAAGFKMPKFKTKVYGSSILGKTVLLNASEIGNAFGRPGYVVTVFYEMELHAASMFNDKTGAGYFSEALDTAVFPRNFEKFIKKFVKCYGCGSLETEFTISELQIAHKCGACGHISEIAMRSQYSAKLKRHWREQSQEMEKEKEGSHKI